MRSKRERGYDDGYTRAPPRQADDAEYLTGYVYGRRRAWFDEYRVQAALYPSVLPRLGTGRHLDPAP